MNDLSLLIPARNEMFTKQTVEDALKHIEADTDIIVTLDGAWVDPMPEQHDRVKIIYSNKPLGQRGATNAAARLSQAKYVMKLDAHCSFDQGFDRKMLEAFEKTGDEVVMVPIMRNLWAFDWKCYHCGWKKYQGPTPQKCEDCGKSDKVRRKMMWVGKTNPQSTSYAFDAEPHFQYFNAYKKRDEYRKSLEETRFTESMSLQGSCFMASREKYWEWELSDENLGNWGNQGIEVAVKAWLAGGRVLCYHDTWYAHMFRTQGGDFSFPWQVSGREVQKTKNNVRDLFWGNNWPKQKRPLSWLVEKFWPIDTGDRGKPWTEEELKKLKELEKGNK